MPLVFKGGKSEQRAIHAGFYIPYFTYSTTTPFCFQGREERTEGIPRNPLHYLLLIFNKQCLLFPREERVNKGHSTQSFTLFTSHSQQATPPVSKGRENEQRAIHADLHLIYVSFSTSNDLLFPREGKLLHGYWYGNMNELADWSHIEQPCNLRQITV